MRKALSVCACLALLAAGSDVFGLDLTDLPSTTQANGRDVYNYDFHTAAYDIVTISFDYDYGNVANIPFGHAAFRIRRLNDDGTDSWLGSFNIHAGSFNLDTDYGPSESAGPLSTGVHHYEFTMNNKTGEWDLSLDGVSGVLKGPAEAGFKNYFSDESPEAIQNALDLGYTSPHPFAKWGLGSNGDYRLQFEESRGGSVNNIGVTAVPTPAAGWMGLALLGGLVTWKRMRRA